jgi:hypothetical protein
MSVTNESTRAGYSHKHDWSVLATMVRGVFVTQTEKRKSILTVNTAGLYDTYIDSLPFYQQTHRCHCCAQFFEQYAGLVCVNDDGKAVSALWDPVGVPAFYAPMVKALKKKVESRPIEGVFYDEQKTWGTKESHDKKRKRDWDHFWVDGSHLRFKSSPYLTPGETVRERLKNDEVCAQAVAAKLEDYKTVRRALEQRYTLAVCEEALRVLKSEAFNRSERYIGPVQWLVDLHVARAATSNERVRQNMLWRAIADAPAGYCHPATSMSGNLLEDIASGVPFEVAQRKFNEKVRGDRFQRSTTAPSTASLAEAEKLVGALGLTADHFRRRYARLEECQTLWLPKAPAASKVGAGVFGRVKARGDAPALTPGMMLSEQTMTWEKFSRTILPSAEQMEAMVPHRGDFTGTLGPVDPDTPPILKWDNNFSRYVYQGGSSASQWGLGYGWTKVTGIIPYAAMWGDNPKPYLGEHLCIALKGAMDTRHDNACLFPEIMREELSNNAGVRRVIESYSQSGKREGSKDGNACGLSFGRGSSGLMLRVTIGASQTVYNIDRWD